MRKKILFTTLAGLVLSLLVLQLLHRNDMPCKDNDVCVAEQESPIIKFGMNMNEYQVEQHEVKRNEAFAGILSQYNIPAKVVDFLARESKAIFNLHRIKEGSTLTLLYPKTDSTASAPLKMIYEENRVDYVVFNFDDSLYVYRGQNKPERRQREVSGVINSSLYETLDRNGIHPSVAVRLSEIFAWSVDFYQIQRGDRFKIIYDEDWVDGEPVRVGTIHCGVFSSGGKENYAFYYEKDASHEGEYYDEKGNSMRKQFLKSPVRFSRISSRFSKKRFHPVTKAWKAHLGTDYAAPYGTPILSTADGTVEEARFKVYNGNYVKIRHNGQYKTQYLHMSKIAKGIRPGSRVKQGDVIGYVGSTGLATGPHVCYRFWKDGAQVDPLKQKLTYAEPLPAKYKADYAQKISPVKSRLDAIAYPAQNEMALRSK